MKLPFHFLAACGLLASASAGVGRDHKRNIITNVASAGSSLVGNILDPLLDPVARKVITTFSGDIRADIAKKFPAEPYQANSSPDEIALCKPVLVIFARGTFDKGTIGELVGPPFLNSLAKLIGKENLGVAGVTPYKADLPGYGIENGSNEGGASVAKMVARAVACENTTAIILVGWSQGAEVIHKGAALSTSHASRISGAILFGDPMNGQPMSGIYNVHTYCSSQDPLCDKAHDTRLDP